MIPIGVVLAPFGAGYTELREAAQQLDQLGFDSVWVWDHYMSQIIPALWIGELVTFQGRYYQLNDAIAAPRQHPRPRIIVGGRSVTMARLAGQYADGLNLQWGFRQTFRTIVEALDATLRERGRTPTDFDLSVHADWRDLMRDPADMIRQWEEAGFRRVMLAASAPFPLREFEQVARQSLA